MGMGFSPCSGYVIPVTERTCKKLNITVSLLEEILHKNEIHPAGEKMHLHWKNQMDYIEELLSLITQEGLEIDVTLNKGKETEQQFQLGAFRYNEEDGERYDDLVDGYYFIIREEDLFEKQYTPIGAELNKKKLDFEFSRWTCYG